MQYLVIFYDQEMNSVWEDAHSEHEAYLLANNNNPSFRFAKILHEAETMQVYQFHRQQQMKEIKIIDRMPRQQKIGME